MTAEQLAEGGTVLQRLSRIAAGGAFLATDDAGDCNYCDYQTVCGNVAAVVGASRRKLANPANTILQPYLELRPHGQTEA